MAFSGLHVTSAYAGPMSHRFAAMPLLGRPVWSETMASAATTAQAAPAVHDAAGEPIFQVRASADSFVAIGASPNASTGARIFVPAGEKVEFYAQPGDRLAWVLA